MTDQANQLTGLPAYQLRNSPWKRNPTSRRGDISPEVEWQDSGQTFRKTALAHSQDLVSLTMASRLHLTRKDASHLWYWPNLNLCNYLGYPDSTKVWVPWFRAPSSLEQVVRENMGCSYHSSNIYMRRSPKFLALNSKPRRVFSVHSLPKAFRCFRN